MAVEHVWICLLRQKGEIAGHVLLDAVDAEQAMHRWYLGNHGYATRKVVRDGRKQLVCLHREIFGLLRGDTRQVDHRNGNTLDCRRSNMRLATPAQNSQNRAPVGGSSKYRGVCFHRQSGLWMAYAQKDRRRTYLGTHKTEEAAARAARQWRLENMTHTNEARVARA